MQAVKIPHMPQLTPKQIYINQAIAGTGQQNSRKIDVYKVSVYLQRYAEKVAGECWEQWLESVGLGTIKQIKESLNQC